MPAIEGNVLGPGVWNAGVEQANIGLYGDIYGWNTQANIADLIQRGELMRAILGNQNTLANTELLNQGRLDNTQLEGLNAQQIQQLVNSGQLDIARLTTDSQRQIQELQNQGLLGRTQLEGQNAQQLQQLVNSGLISQQQLENLGALDLARLQGQTDLGVQGLQNQGALNVAQLQGLNAQQIQQLVNSGQVNLAELENTGNLDVARLTDQGETSRAMLALQGQLAPLELDRERFDFASGLMGPLLSRMFGIDLGQQSAATPEPAQASAQTYSPPTDAERRTMIGRGGGNPDGIRTTQMPSAPTPQAPPWYQERFGTGQPTPDPTEARTDASYLRWLRTQYEQAQNAYGQNDPYTQQVRNAFGQAQQGGQPTQRTNTPGPAGYRTPQTGGPGAVAQQTPSRYSGSATMTNPRFARERGDWGPTTGPQPQTWNTIQTPNVPQTPQTPTTPSTPGGGMPNTSGSRFGLNTADLITPQHQQQMENRAQAANAKTEHAANQSALSRMGQAGFSSRSPAMAAIQNRNAISRGAADVDAQTSIGLQVPQLNATNRLANQQIMSGIYGTDVGFDAVRYRADRDQSSQLLAALFGLLN